MKCMVETTLSEILQKLETLQSDVSSIKHFLSIGNSKSGRESIVTKSARPESFMEFFNKFDPKNEADKALVIMRFMELNEGKTNVTTKDITEGFKAVREKVPINVADKIQWLHKKGRVMPGESVDNLKGWLITRSGLDYLEELENANK